MHTAEEFDVKKVDIEELFPDKDADHFKRQGIYKMAV